MFIILYLKHLYNKDKIGYYTKYDKIKNYGSIRKLLGHDLYL